MTIPEPPEYDLDEDAYEPDLEPSEPPEPEPDEPWFWTPDTLAEARGEV